MKSSGLSALFVVPSLFLAFSCGGSDDPAASGGASSGGSSGSSGAHTGGASAAGSAGKGSTSGGNAAVAGSANSAGASGEGGTTSAGGAPGGAGESSGGESNGGEGGADSASCTVVGSCLATNGVCFSVPVEAKAACEANAGSVWATVGCLERGADVGGGCMTGSGTPDCKTLWQPTSVSNGYPTKKLQCENSGGIWVVAPTK